MPPWVAKKGANTSDSTAISLISMLRDGPDVSLSGSPTVSPITAALCASDPLGPRVLACSDAPAYHATINSKSVRQPIIQGFPFSIFTNQFYAETNIMKSLKDAHNFHSFMLLFQNTFQKSEKQFPEAVCQTIFVCFFRNENRKPKMQNDTKQEE